MVLMVRSFRSTMNLLQWLLFSFIIVLSMFAVYCVESKPNFPNNDMSFYQKRRLLIESSKDKNTTPANTNLIPTNLVLVSTLDGSIRGIDRFEGRVHWTLKGGPGSSLIKSNSHFETHKLYKEGPMTKESYSSPNINEEEDMTMVEEEEEEEDDDDYKLFVDTLRDIESDEESDSEDDEFDEFNLEQYNWENKQSNEEPEIYYIIEPQDGGSLYVYGDGRPLEVK